MTLEVLVDPDSTGIGYLEIAFQTARIGQYETCVSLALLLPLSVGKRSI
jgi:hypothetical protein